MAIKQNPTSLMSNSHFVYLNKCVNEMRCYFKLATQMMVLVPMWGKGQILLRITSVWGDADGGLIVTWRQYKVPVYTNCAVETRGPQ